MALTTNPFYVLKLSCGAERRQIIAATEEMSLLRNADECTKAQGELINIGKRLTAEMGWFLDVDEDELETIRENIDNEEPISTDGLSSLDRLNASIYNFSLLEEDDIYELGYLILDIDEQFSELDAYEIADSINENRTLANLAEVAVDEISAEFNKKRDEIKQVISDKLFTLEQDSYVEFATLIAEKYADEDEEYSGDILGDILDQYEVRMQAEIESEAEQIKNKIEQIKQLVNDDAIANNINGLIRRIKQWDVLAQPLQLKSQASGMPHEISEDLGHEIREFAIYLHNELGATDEALILIEAMKNVFAELGELADLFETDSDTLADILNGQKDAEAIIAELESIKVMASNIKSSPNNMSVTNFITKIKALNSKMKLLPLDDETKENLRSGLCFIAREAAVEIHNTKKQTALALQIAQALCDSFSDIEELRVKLLQDKITLSQQVNITQTTGYTSTSNSSSYSGTTKSNNSGCLIFVVIAIIIAILIGISDGGSGSSSSSKSSGSSSYSTTSEVQYSSGVSAGDNVYVDIKSIFPEIGIYTQGSSNYSHFVCECKMSNGGTVWVYMTTSEYKSNFDSSVSTSVSSAYADEKTFSSAKRVHGTVKRADNIMSGLSLDTGTYVIDFNSVK